ncbi:hypothetical protein BGX38DRAFT_1226425 [Terfezia claveryi]|nr:hypothetical protein BGX38DRAFT_1226425 [Terfezia claveryi]
MVVSMRFSHNKIIELSLICTMSILSKYMYTNYISNSKNLNNMLLFILLHYFLMSFSGIFLNLLE